MSTSWADMNDGDAAVDSGDAPGKIGLEFKPTIIESKLDAQGIKTVTEYTINDKKEKIKITRRVKVTKKPVRVNKHVQARRKWTKFGDCRGCGKGPENNVTYVSFETIVLDVRPKSRDEEEQKENDGLSKLSDSSSSIVVCRHCGETGHWTLKCPKRGTIVPKGMNKDDVVDIKTGPRSTSTDGKYVPVHMRAGAERSGVSMHRDEGCTLRVTNLSEEVTEDDLTFLFREYGHMTRVYLAKFKNVSRGFAFISYSDRSCAQRAIDNLHGHGYDNLILHVEWAKPREQDPDAAQSIRAGIQGARKF